MSTLHSLAASLIPPRRPRFLGVFFRFANGVMQTEKMDAVFTQHAPDWLRLNAYFWVIWTDKTVDEWYEILRFQITPQDYVMIFPVDLKDRAGWAEKWVWEWIDQPR